MIPYFTLNTKINSTQIKDSNVKVKTIKLLEENIREYYHKLGVGKDFLNRTQRALFKSLKNWTFLILKTSVHHNAPFRELPNR